MKQNRKSKQAIPGRQSIWAAIQYYNQVSEDKTFTKTQLATRTKRNKRTIGSYLEALEAAGIVQKVGTLPSKGANPHNLYKLCKDVGFEAPRVNKQGKFIHSASEQMWRAMKMLKVFTSRSLALAASIEESPVNEAHAKDYCKHLLKAGYILLVEPQKLFFSQASYRLAPGKNTGPEAPKITRAKCVYDPNLNEIVWMESLEDAQ